MTHFEELYIIIIIVVTELWTRAKTTADGGLGKCAYRYAFKIVYPTNLWSPIGRVAAAHAEM
jgi:hypothetical protein